MFIPFICNIHNFFASEFVITESTLTGLKQLILSKTWLKPIGILNINPWRYLLWEALHRIILRCDVPETNVTLTTMYTSLHEHLATSTQQKQAQRKSHMLTHC